MGYAELIAMLEKLPPERQAEVFDFAEFIAARANAAGADSRLTREALDDVDAGRVIDHQAVQAWADSLGTANPLPVPR